MKAFISILALTLAALPALAQSNDTRDAEADSEEFRQLAEAEALELSGQYPVDRNIIELVQRIMITRLSQRLGLTIDETQDLSHKVGQCRDQLYNLKWLRAEKRLALRQAIAEGEMDSVERQLEKLLRLEVTIAELTRKMIDDSRDELSLEQAAEFYLFIEDFEEDIGDTIEHARRISRERSGDSESDSSRGKDD